MQVEDSDAMTYSGSACRLAICFWTIRCRGRGQDGVPPSDLSALPLRYMALLALGTPSLSRATDHFTSTFTRIQGWMQH